MLLFSGCRRCKHTEREQKSVIVNSSKGIGQNNDATVIGKPKKSNDKTKTNNSRKIQVEADMAVSAAHQLLLTTCEQDLPEQIILRKAYITSYNKQTRCPNWVGWHLTREHADGPVDRFNAFHEDESVPFPKAFSSDYKGSGWTRGHMCPAGDNKWDHDAMYNTFSYINICPQNANLNNGLWNSIEMDCRKWAKKYGEIFIVCGPLFLNREHETIGDNKVFVPEAFFKVMLIMNPKPQAFGFIARNTDGGRKRDLYYNSIDEVERITHYDFFSALPDSIENIVESEKANPEEW